MIPLNKKVLFFNYESLESANGVSKFVRELMSNLPNSRCVSFANLKKDNTHKHEINLGLKKLFGETFFLKTPHRSIIKREIFNSDIIHLNMDNFSSILIAFMSLLYKKPLVFNLHSNLVGVGGIKGKLNRLRTIIVHNLLVLMANKSFWLTQEQLSIFKKYTLFKSRLMKRATVVPNFISYSYDGGNIKKLLREVIFVGRYTKMKGFQDLLALTKVCPNIKFGFVGGKIQKKDLRENITNYGLVGPNRMTPYYRKGTLLILPSYTEVFPFTILEAMANGLVILVSNIPGMKEIIKENRNGYLFKPGNILSMKEIIDYLKDNPAEIERISKNNVQDIKKFSSEKQVPKYFKIYNELLK